MHGLVSKQIKHRFFLVDSAILVYAVLGGAGLVPALDEKEAARDDPPASSARGGNQAMNGLGD